MKARLKSILILGITLAIGIAIGALSWSSIHNRRMEKLREMRNQGGLYSSVDRYIDPVDADQEQAIRAITDEFQRRYGSIYRESGRKLEVESDSFRVALYDVLTDEQKQAIRPLFHRRGRDDDRRDDDRDDDRRGDGRRD